MLIDAALRDHGRLDVQPGGRAAWMEHPNPMLPKCVASLGHGPVNKVKVSVYFIKTSKLFRYHGHNDIKAMISVSCLDLLGIE